jgi:hypothetical protein
MPGTGTGIPGLEQKQIGFLVDLVSKPPPPTILTPASVIGGRQLQQTSVIGLTILPVQPIAAFAELL